MGHVELSATADRSPAASAITISATPPGSSSTRARAVAHLKRTVLPPFIVFWIFVGIWCLFSYVMLAPSLRFLLPAPPNVIQIGVLNWGNFSAILSAAEVTVQAAVLGFAIAVALGTAMAVVMSQAKWIERSLFPYAVMLQTVPILALVPLIGFWLGYNFPSRVLVCVMISIFPIITNVLFGLLSVDPSLRDIFTMNNASRWTRLRKLEVPAALPAFFTGLRISAGASVVGAIIGDYFFLKGTPGLGALINSYSLNLQSEQLFTTVIVSSLMGIAAFVLVGLVSRKVIGSWHESVVRPGDR
jgi:NitT/TauT family transport system permease protein